MKPAQSNDLVFADVPLVLNEERPLFRAEAVESLAREMRTGCGVPRLASKLPEDPSTTIDLSELVGRRLEPWVVSECPASTPEPARPRGTLQLAVGSLIVTFAAVGIAAVSVLG